MLSIFVLLEDILGVKQTATCLRQNLSQASILAHYIYIYISKFLKAEESTFPCMQKCDCV